MVLVSILLTEIDFLQVLLLMATALNLPISTPALDKGVHMLSTELRTRQQCIAEITEMIHVNSL